MFLIGIFFPLFLYASDIDFTCSTEIGGCEVHYYVSGNTATGFMNCGDGLIDLGSGPYGGCPGEINFDFN